MNRLPSILSEADTRAKLIDPALHQRGWTEDHVRREETAGGIEITEGTPKRQSKGRIDYTLRLRVIATAQPVAVAYIEAKAAHKAPTAGLQQVKSYAAVAQRFHVPFVFSTNGHLFVEYDHFSHQTSEPKPIIEFPTPEELRRRYECGIGFSLADDGAKPLLIPYPGGEATRRYYQDAAIRATLETIAAGRHRVLLSLATGAGKTFIAVNLLKRLDAAGQLRRALFLCDRDELRTQALGAFSQLFSSNAAEVFETADGKNHARNARIQIATYQTLDSCPDEHGLKFFFKHYPERNHFSHIIIDECHRSAFGDWHYVLKNNPEAVQIGLTATPRQIHLAQRPRGGYRVTGVEEDEKRLHDNLEYFGTPVYEYTLAQGIEDGYLAPPEIFTFDLFHDNKSLMERADHVNRDEVKDKKLTDANTGLPVSPANLQIAYAPTEIDERLLMPDRVRTLSRHFFHQLLEHGGGPEQKSILFCASDRHADLMAGELNRLYNDWCIAQGAERKENFAFKCTAKSGGGNYVADLRGSVASHFLACTVELLSTGVDVPCVRNLAFMQYIRSPIVFNQMFGRGTRIDIDSEKMMFRVYDYTDATSLLGREFKTRPANRSKGGPPPPPPPPPIVVEGVEVIVRPTGRWLTVMLDGRQLKISVEEYRERIAERLVAAAAEAAAFRRAWIHPATRRDLLNAIITGGFSPVALRRAEEAEACDLFDVLGEVGYGFARQTRADRVFAFTYKARPWLDGMAPDSAATIRALASQFARGGTDVLETPQLFNTPEVCRAGGLQAIASLGDPATVLLAAKERLFSA